MARTPCRNAKHHFGAATSRGTRLSNYDTFQAGVLDILSFAKQALAEPGCGRLRHSDISSNYRKSYQTDTAPEKPQVFYMGIDVYGGLTCSKFLQENLPTHIHNTVSEFGIHSCLTPNPEGCLAPLPTEQKTNRMRLERMDK